MPSPNKDDTLPSPSPPNPSQITASCHCNRITIHLPRPPTKLNECRCSICYRYGALWGYYPRDKVDVVINIPSPPSSSTGKKEDNGAVPLLRSYVRTDGDDQGDIAFFFCGHCGCLTHWGLTEKGAESLRKGKEEAERVRDEDKETDLSEFGVNCRMIRPSLLEGVEHKVGKFEDFQ